MPQQSTSYSTLPAPFTCTFTMGEQGLILNFMGLDLHHQVHLVSEWRSHIALCEEADNTCPLLNGG